MENSSKEKELKLQEFSVVGFGRRSARRRDSSNKNEKKKMKIKKVERRDRRHSLRTTGGHSRLTPLRLHSVVDLYFHEESSLIHKQLANEMG